MNWSDEQNLVFAWFGNTQPEMLNASVMARAGTGKTTTIKEAFSYAPEKKILYAVFNKRNQKEAQEKISDCRVDVMTLHSLGYKFIRSQWAKATPDDNVESYRVKTAIDTSEFCFIPDKREMFSSLIKLISFAKNTTINPTIEDLVNIAAAKDLLIDNVIPENLARIALGAMALAKEKDAAGRISFDDMVWLPVAMEWVKPSYGLVCIDEAQDMNLPQLTMARLASSGRVCVVGDDRQAIYGFRGAVQDGMRMMRETLGAVELGLTTTYRCPRKVVDMAAKIVPDYKSAPEAPDGEVCRISEYVMAGKVVIGDVILSRLNAPLMPLALNFLRKNIPARIEGRDIGKQLSGMIRSMKAKSVNDLVEKIEAWLTNQVDRLSRSRDAEKKIQSADDLAKTLIALAQDCDTVDAVQVKLDGLFSDTDSTSKPAVVLSTVHKAKGLEWDRVFILSETFNRPGMTGSEEVNIYYVAITRAKKALYLVGGKETREEENEPKAEVKPIAQPVKSAPAIPLRKKVIPVTPGAMAPKPRTDEEPLPGMVWLSPGIVFSHSGREFVSVRLGPSNAKCEPMDKGSDPILCSRSIDKGSVIRRMTHEELNQFLTGNARSRKGTTQQSGNESENNNMAKVKTEKSEKKAPKAKMSMTGSSEYVKKLYADGLTKAQANEKLAEKFPWFADKNDYAGFESRWNMAEKKAKKAAEKAKEAKAEAKAPKAGKGKKAAPVPARKKKASIVPPPRKTAPVPGSTAATLAEVKGESPASEPVATSEA